MLPQLKAVPFPGASFTNGATASGIIDTVGYDWATIDVIAATADVVSNSPSVLKLQEADVTNATSFADVVAFVGGTAVDATHGFVIPNAQTAATSSPLNEFKFNVDLRGRKRYLQWVVSPRTTQIIAAIANLGRGEQAPITAAKANANVLVEG